MGLFLDQNRSPNRCTQHVGKLLCHQDKFAGIGAQMSMANLQTYWNFPSHVIHSNSWNFPTFSDVAIFILNGKGGKSLWTVPDVDTFYVKLYPTLLIAHRDEFMICVGINVWSSFTSTLWNWFQSKHWYCIWEKMPWLAAYVQTAFFE